MIAKIVIVAALAVVGLIAVLCGLLSNQLVNSIIRRQLSKRLPLVNGSVSLPKWSNVKVPVFMKYHIFHITNLNEVLNGASPVFEEKGPFVFRQKVKKEVLEWNDDETQMTFATHKTYFFEESLSNGSLSDSVTIPNLPVLGIVTIIMDKAIDSWWKATPVRLAVNNFISAYPDESPFLNITVGELLFDGKRSEFLAGIKSLLSKVNMEMSDIPEDAKFCLMRGKNHSADGNWTIETGKINLNEFGTVRRFSNLTELSCWKGGSCNQIRGTDGMMFHPFISKDEELALFSSDVKRSLALKFEEDAEIQGIKALKFIIPKDEFRCPRYYEPNKCFCVADERDDTLDVCKYDGMLDMSSCLKGKPIVISLPHFYIANDSFVNHTIGMHPSKQLHETFLKIDPISGIVVSVAKRLQLNFHIKQSYGIDILEKIKTGVYPVAWFEEGATMDEKTAGDLKAALHNKISLMKNVLLAVLIVGVILIMIASILLFLFLRTELRKKQEKTAQRNSYVYSNLQKNHEKEENKIDTNRA